ncbi:uncharacterized protein LOC119338577 [Triticum dicoccoides]|uniref:uncharacterized protein LOC119338577 n=1 Tax=Triticum dicoccoides TaxID=85692 RepID=UPI001890C6C0|nr:uncharacterized protein LOC119338577 [Triticum dicoccoides]
MSERPQENGSSSSTSATTNGVDLKIVPPAGFLLHRRAAVPSAPILRGRSASGRCGLAILVSSSNGAAGLSPLSDSEKKGPVVMEIPLENIRTRANDPDEVQKLMDSIRVIGLQVPVGIFSFNINFYQNYFLLVHKLNYVRTGIFLCGIKYIQIKLYTELIHGRTLLLNSVISIQLSRGCLCYG